MPVDVLRVGKLSIPLAKAEEWVRTYTDPLRPASASPYAYPAYDTYECDRIDPDRLHDADLLAPGLLNVPVKIRSFYGLCRIREELEAGLANIDVNLALADVDDPEEIAAMVKPLYSVLDNPSTKPWNVQATTFSKILHRKRPRSLVLHDKWVRECYVGEGGPVPRARNRTWADYMAEVSVAIAEDVRSQREAFARLDEATGKSGCLNDIRLLDIVAWTSKGEPPSEAAQ